MNTTHRPFVGYLTADHERPPRVGYAYDYILAANGAFLATENDRLAVCLPVADCRIRGLASIAPVCELRHGRIPYTLWTAMLAIAHRFATCRLEVLVVVTWSSHAGYRITIPEQEVSSTRIRYRPVEDMVLELHSHHTLPATFSAVDTADETRLGLYGVIGGLDTPAPAVRLRAGAYGAFLALPWSAVFEGDLGPIHDHYPSCDAGNLEDTYELPD